MAIEGTHGLGRHLAQFLLAAASGSLTCRALGIRGSCTRVLMSSALLVAQPLPGSTQVYS